jgi:hypothetical protein
LDFRYRETFAMTDVPPPKPDGLAEALEDVQPALAEALKAPPPRSPGHVRAISGKYTRHMIIMLCVFFGMGLVLGIAVFVAMMSSHGVTRAAMYGVASKIGFFVFVCIPVGVWVISTTRNHRALAARGEVGIGRVEGTSRRSAEGGRVDHMKVAYQAQDGRARRLEVSDAGLYERHPGGSVIPVLTVREKPSLVGVVIRGVEVIVTRGY